MNKAELVTSVADKSKLTKKNSDAAIKGFIDTIEEVIAKGEKVKLLGFGNFKTVVRSARKGRNPRTKEIISIPGSIQPKFTPGEEFKKLVNK